MAEPHPSAGRPRAPAEDDDGFKRTDPVGATVGSRRWSFSRCRADPGPDPGPGVRVDGGDDPENVVREAYRVHYRRLVAQLFGLIGDVAEAEDAVQEAFARVLTSPKSFLGADDPERWLRVVALNVAR